MSTTDLNRWFQALRKNYSRIKMITNKQAQILDQNKCHSIYNELAMRILNRILLVSFGLSHIDSTNIFLWHWIKFFFFFEYVLTFGIQFSKMNWKLKNSTNRKKNNNLHWIYFGIQYFYQNRTVLFWLSSKGIMVEFLLNDYHLKSYALSYRWHMNYCD